MIGVDVATSWTNWVDVPVVPAIVPVPPENEPVRELSVAEPDCVSVLDDAEIVPVPPPSVPTWAPRVPVPPSSVPVEGPAVPVPMGLKLDTPES